MEGDTPSTAIPLPIVRATTIQSGHTLGICKLLTASTDSMTTRSMSEEDQQDRALRALRVTVMSGFMGTVINTQASCLSLCNTCRVSVPAQSLTVCPRTPPSILAMVSPSSKEAKPQHSSRVFPYRRVLKVHWMFLDYQDFELVAAQALWPTRKYGKERRTLITPETSLAADCNVELSTIRWPEGTTEIYLSCFNECMDCVAWPAGLETLWLGEPRVAYSMEYGIPEIFNTCITGVSLPSGLREIFLGDKFNQPIDGVDWPEGLERLSLPGFNQSLRYVKWPPGLKALEFVSPKNILLWTGGAMYHDFVHDGGDQIIFSPARPFNTSRYLWFNDGGCRFDQPLGTTLPSSLETLWLSEAFDQPLDNVAWPEGLVTLGLAFDFHDRCYPTSIIWPSRLQDLFVRCVDDMWDVCPRGSTIHTLETR